MVVTSAALLVCAAISVPASAEVGVPAGTVQQAAADALFLQYAPAPPTPGIICLVDSGVTPNPDTTAILAGSYALSPDTNTEDELAALDPPLPGGHPAAHGTYMAMIAAAPANTWGMVGLAPTSVRIYNVKALAAGHTTFSFSEYASAIEYCQDLSSSMPVTVVNLSLGSSTQPTGSELETVENYVQSANAHGLSVIAAVGNEAGPVQAPADLQGVLGVGASDASATNRGAICSFSNRGAGLALLAPGCGSQTEPGGEGSGIEIAFSDDGTPAWADGTSDATAIASAAEASMRAYAPSLTYSQAQSCITSTLTNGGNLDVAAAFNACGLGQVVQEGMAAYQAANNSSSTTPPANSGPPAATLTTPKRKPILRRPKITKITFRKHHLTITVADIPKGLRLKLLVQDKGELGRLLTIAQTTTQHTTATLHVGQWDRIVARFLAGHTELPQVVVNRTTHDMHASVSKWSAG
ncbi:MAG: S8 family serine peptidase [Solirubrobacteraceae bacterium]